MPTFKPFSLKSFAADFTFLEVEPKLTKTTSASSVFDSSHSVSFSSILDRALRWQCAREDVDAEEAADYRRTIVDAISDGGATVAEWFDPTHKVYAERSIYVPSSDESFRPDRVVVRPDGSVVVVDYKFTSETRRSHYRQVSRYVELLHSLGRPLVEGYIWYPVLKKIIKVQN